VTMSFADGTSIHSEDGADFWKLVYALVARARKLRAAGERTNKQRIFRAANTCPHRRHSSTSEAPSCADDRWGQTQHSKRHSPATLI